MFHCLCANGVQFRPINANGAILATFGNLVPRLAKVSMPSLPAPCATTPYKRLGERGHGLESALMSALRLLPFVLGASLGSSLARVLISRFGSYSSRICQKGEPGQFGALP